MRIAVIDNVDSFVYNLVQYLGELGARLKILRNNESIRKIESFNPEGLVISPGPGRPKNAGISNKAVEKFAGKVPILGVCLGHQVIARSFGSKIGHAKQIVHGKTSKMNCEIDPLFKGISNPLEATRYHSLVVKDRVPGCLKVICRTATDDSDIMGIKHVNMDIWGVQFHPESILTEGGKRILKNFLGELGN